MNTYEPREESVAIIGAGLVGCLAALNFAKLGYYVTLFELRDDPRLKDTTDKNLRSINLAVSERGIKSLNYVDLEMSLRVLSKIVPMKARMVHDIEGNQNSIPYGIHGESINSIDRGFLNVELLNEIDMNNNIQILFGLKLVKLDFNSKNHDNPVVYFQSNKKKDDDKSNPIQSYEFDFVIGADGAYSQTRFQLQKFIRMNFEQEYIDTAYIELVIPPGRKNSYQLDPNHLHIWPREKFMLMAMPNHDGSFTSTFFGPWDLLKKLNNDEKVLEFFQENFPDSINLIGLQKLLYAFKYHPKGALVCTFCDPYNYKGKCIIIGDAAHSMVPFYGQGMNCGFEDVRVLTDLLKKHDFDTEASFQEYSETRNKDLIAIINLAKENYKEMTQKVNTKQFQIRKTIDNLLYRLLGDKWLPLYTMVSFRNDISYSEAIRRGKKQYNIITGIQVGIATVGILAGYKYSRSLISSFTNMVIKSLK